MIGSHTQGLNERVKTEGLRLQGQAQTYTLSSATVPRTKRRIRHVGQQTWTTKLLVVIFSKPSILFNTQTHLYSFYQIESKAFQ